MSETSDQPPSEPNRSRRPRIRTGAVIWGLLLVATALLALWMATRPRGRDRLVEAVFALDGFGWTVVTVIAIGATVTLIALAAVIRHVQHRLAKAATTTR